MSFRYRHGDRPLEGYTILRGVGRGGFGEVYFAVSDGGRQVALKWIGQYADVELRGVGQCINLKSPHLVAIFDVRRAPDGTPFVIMEYVAGPSLREILRRSPRGVGSRAAAYFVREIGKGLAYLHDRGIVHRDLKPENIFYEEGYVKIGDYGLSKAISPSRQSGHTLSVGTVHYMAPEIGSGTYHRGIDIYALGVILYELLTGRVPFDGSSFGEILMKHLTARPNLDGIEVPFAEVIARALEKKPEDRYGSVDAMVEALLADEKLGSALDGFDHASLGSFASAEAIEAETAADAGKEGIGPAGPAPRRRERDGSTGGARDAAGGGGAAARVREVPRDVAGLLRDARSALAAARKAISPAAEALRGGAEGLGLRLLLALAAIFGMAGVTALLQGGGHPEGIFFWAAMAMGAGALVVLGVERGLVPRYRLEQGPARRLLTLGCILPILFVLGSVPVGFRGSPVAALALAIVLVRWSDRVKLRRAERVSLRQALGAGLAGVIFGAIFDCGPALVGGITAGISLAVNAAAPFEARGRRAAAAGGGPGPAPEAAAEPAAPPGAAPVGARDPARPSRSEPRPAAWVKGDGAGVARVERRAVPAQSTTARVLWLVLSAGFLSAGLGLAAAVFAFGHAGNLPGGPILYGGALLAAFGIVALAKGLARRRGPFWRGTVLPFALAGTLATAACAFGWAVAGGPRSVRSEEGALAVGALASSLVCSAFLTLGIIRSRAREARDGTIGGSAAVNGIASGWSALGWLLLILAGAAVLGAGLLATGLGDAILRESGIRTPWTIAEFVGRRLHLAAGLLLFLPGLFCVLQGRRSGGGAHVLRGAVGLWMAGGVAAFIADLFPRSIAVTSGYRIHLLGTVSADTLALTFLVAGLAAVLVAWPAARPADRPVGRTGDRPAAGRLPGGRPPGIHQKPEHASEAGPAAEDPEDETAPPGTKGSSVLLAALSTAPALAEVVRRAAGSGSGWGG